MSTICKLALTASQGSVVQLVEAFLQNCNQKFTLSETEWPASSDRNKFIVDRIFPTVLSVKQVTPEVTEIHYNSFDELTEMAAFLSKRKSVKVVVNIYQSVSSASHWAFYDGGTQIRAIEAGESVAKLQFGERLPFEGPEPGTPCEDDPTLYFFDSSEQDWYNREVGVPVEVYENYGQGWINFLLD
jgi:hypothetical protein